VSTYREDDSDPKEEFVNHMAGRDGLGPASYINGVICRNRDNNTAWTSASDGVLEQRAYYEQNWRGDVVALIKTARFQLEQVRYSAYGVPFGLPFADTDSDGDLDSTDVGQINTWIGLAAYDVRADVDLDGDIDTLDKSLADLFDPIGEGREEISWVGNATGFGSSCHAYGLLMIGGAVSSANKGQLSRPIAVQPGEAEEELEGGLALDGPEEDSAVDSHCDNKCKGLSMFRRRRNGNVEIAARAIVRDGNCEDDPDHPNACRSDKKCRARPVGRGRMSCPPGGPSCALFVTIDNAPAGGFTVVEPGTVGTHVGYSPQVTPLACDDQAEQKQWLVCAKGTRGSLVTQVCVIVKAKCTQCGGQ